MSRGTAHNLSRLFAMFALLVAAAIMASGCGTSKATAGSADGPVKRGGTIILGMDQEPSCLNTWLVCGGMVASTLAASPMFDSFVGINPEGKRFPLLAVEVPSTENGLVKLTGKTMTVTENIRPEAHWSDGVPITCADMVFTWKTIMSDKWTIGSRLGWDKIASIECPNERTMVFNFSELYAPYMGVVGSAPLPSHALRGKDFNTYMSFSIPVSSGPYKFKVWNRSVNFILERDPKYWNRGKNDQPYIDKLKFVFIPDTNTLKVQLRTGEVDWINPPPDTSLQDELKSFPRADYQVEQGAAWEQIAFNTSKAPTDNVNVRKALSYGIDRKQITDVVLRGQTTVLNSTLLPAAKDYYVPAWKEYDFDPAKVKEYLTKAGYARQGKWWIKNGKPLVVVFKSTAGNVLREKVAQLLQERYRTLGIKLEIQMEAPEVFFGQSAVQGAYGMGLWAWSGSIDPSQTSLFACDQIPKRPKYEGSNNYRYCNPRVTELLKLADRTPDVKGRSAALREAQTLMAADIPLLPLYQRPEIIAYSNTTKGIAGNPLGGQTWNTYDWWKVKAQ